MAKPWHLAATLGALAVPGAIGVGVVTREIAPIDGVGMLAAAYTAYNPVTGAWNPDLAMANYGAIGIGAAASKIFSKLKLNSLYPKGFNI